MDLINQLLECLFHQTNIAPIIIDSFFNDDGIVSIRSVFLSNADKNLDKELSLIVANYNDGFWHGDTYYTWFYKLPASIDNSSLSDTLIKLDMNIEGGCDCISPNNNRKYSTAKTASTVKNILIKKGFKQ